MSQTENQFSVTRAASKTGGAAKKQIPISDYLIQSHLGSVDTHGYEFIGHGDESAIINTYSLVGSEAMGTGPDRYSRFGLAFLTLKSCYSAEQWPVRGRYRYNPWESNVSTRGWFVGYTGEVTALTEPFMWATTHGKNNRP